MSTVSLATHAGITVRYLEETQDPLLVAAATWILLHIMLPGDMLIGSLESP